LHLFLTHSSFSNAIDHFGYYKINVFSTKAVLKLEEKKLKQTYAHKLLSFKIQPGNAPQWIAPLWCSN